MEPMFAAGQRGKRAVALDMKAPEASAVLDRMFRWSDVVHHNSRLGLAEKLGYDEATVRTANPDVVYSFASGFGQTGPRALLPANDQLMQALAGIETGQGGAGQPPTYLV
jgi:crotonobetainyl-CoA:carnitine CoA-transferase CaiB-like acyl-CoA transferase